MADLRTVLVLGAGASWPYGFPTGRGLIRKICQEFVGKACRLARSGAPPELAEAEARRFVQTLQTAQVNSIDEFLEGHEGFRDIGRLAIAATLLPCEDDDHLFGWGERPQKDHWYQHLWDWLAADGYEGLASRPVSIVTFNYDRSLERYLFVAIQKRFGRGEEEAANVVNRLPIVHVHGRLGRLPWQDGATEAEAPEPAVDFGGAPPDSHAFRPTVVNASKAIKIIYENVDQSPALEQARRFLQDAQAVLFLGFGFHRVNLTRLLRGLALQPQVTAAGTCYDLREGEIDRNIRGRLLPLLAPMGCTVPEHHSAARVRDRELRLLIEGVYDTRSGQMDWSPATIVLSSNTRHVVLELAFLGCMNLEFLKRTPHLLRP